MKLVATVIVLLAPVGLAHSVRAQEPLADTTSAWRYFPLALGNVWTYGVRQLENDSPCLPCEYSERQEVTGTITAGGRDYFEVSVRRTGALPDGVPTADTFYARFDTAAATAFRLNDPASPASEYPLDHGGCRLDEAFPADPEEGRDIDCSNDLSEGAVVFGGYERPVSIGSYSYALTEKAFAYFTFGYSAATYAAGVGLLSVSGCEGCEYEAELRYALVGGAVYGAPPLSAEPTGPAEAFSLAAYPSPSRGPVRLAVLLPEPGAVTVSVFDLLGRLVHTTTEGPVAGEGHVELDATGWPPGVYLIRLAAASRVVTTRLVVQ